MLSLHPHIKLYLIDICKDFNICWEDYLIQLDYEFPLFKFMDNYKGVVLYVEIFLYFVELGLNEYRTILKDLIWIIKNE